MNTKALLSCLVIVSVAAGGVAGEQAPAGRAADAAPDTLLQKLQQEADAEWEAGQSELLGATGAEQLKQYERELPARDIVSGMAGTAAVRGMAFSPAQAEQLTQALAAASEFRPATGK